RLYQELQNSAATQKNGNLDYAQLEADCIRRLTDAGWVVDYVEIRHAHSLAVDHVGDKELVVLAAARLGTTSLFDNLELALC
ncbi:pantoate--beta-alanine ligase, partial [Neisseria sp. P0004.S001]|uniref:pantoate--beta-alanine ligase n=1 Tax=Neisseria sp. P0004.S001 TaxID=3436665 RepID=UPI003F7E7639